MIASINVFGVKGGVGTSTIAAALALELSKDSSVILRGAGQDLNWMLGRSSDPMEDYAFIRICAPPARVCVEDFGTGRPAGKAPDTLNIMVMRNDYISIRQALHIENVDFVILVAENYRALTASDVQAVLSDFNIVSVPFNEGLARSSDAGVLEVRGCPREVSRALQPIVMDIRGA